MYFTSSKKSINNIKSQHEQQIEVFPEGRSVSKTYVSRNTAAKITTK